MLIFLTTDEAEALKRNVPWNDIDPGIRDLVRVANSVPGIATLQSCEGHIKETEIGFYVESAKLAFRAAGNLTQKIMWELAPKVGLDEVSIRYFENGTFWICIGTDPAHKSKMYKLFEMLKETI